MAEKQLDFAQKALEYLEAAEEAEEIAHTLAVALAGLFDKAKPDAEGRAIAALVAYETWKLTIAGHLSLRSPCNATTTQQSANDGHETRGSVCASP